MLSSTTSKKKRDDKETRRIKSLKRTKQAVNHEVERLILNSYDKEEQNQRLILLRKCHDICNINE